MTFAEAWPDIEKFLLEAMRTETGSTIDELPAGDDDGTVTELERRLKRKLPEELKFYLKHHPFTDYAYVDFYQGFELFGSAEISFEKSRDWGGFPEAEDIVSTPLVIGQDTSIAFVTDLDDEACPVYRVDEVYDWVPELMASSLADFLYLLSYRETLYQTSLSEHDDDVQRSRDTVNDQSLEEMLSKKIEMLAPGCSETWK